MKIHGLYIKCKQNQLKNYPNSNKNKSCYVSTINDSTPLAISKKILNFKFLMKFFKTFRLTKLKQKSAKRRKKQKAKQKRKKTKRTKLRKKTRME